MENEKKSSRFGVRLSAIVVAVLLVVCMAVPAFAYSVDSGSSSSGFEPMQFDVPDDYPYYMIIPGRNSIGNPVWYCYAFKSVPYSNQFGVNTYSSNQMVVDVNISYGLYYSSESTKWNNTFTQDLQFNKADKAYISGNFDLLTTSGDVYYSPPPPPPPPPPDIKDNVTSGLTIVLDWVGATVSALFSGSLSGLLPLVAVPVAIMLLLVAIIVIKRSIWGA